MVLFSGYIFVIRLARSSRVINVYKIWEYFNAKIFYDPLDILIIEIILLIGAYMVNYFTTRIMGMLRHVIHKNYVW